MNVVRCTDDDTARHTWTNDQGSAQTAFFVIDAYSTGAGSFTVSWSVIDRVGPTCEGDDAEGILRSAFESSEDCLTFMNEQQSVCDVDMSWYTNSIINGSSRMADVCCETCVPCFALRP